MVDVAPEQRYTYRAFRSTLTGLYNWTMKDVVTGKIIAGNVGYNTIDNAYKSAAAYQQMYITKMRSK